MRSWFVIPAMGVACGGAAVGLGLSPTLGLAGAAIAAVIRMLAGDSPAALSGAVLAPLLAVATWADAGGALVRAAIAIAAAGWTITELARSPDGRASEAMNDNAPPVEATIPYSPWLALGPAALAAILEPGCVALVAIAGARLITAPGRRTQWALAAPLVGAFLILFAALAGTTWHGLGAVWFARAAHPTALAGIAGHAGEVLGPLTAVAALAGLSALTRPRYAEIALAACIAGCALVDVRAGALGPASIGLAALLAGLALGRLAALIRVPSGQAITGAAFGVLVMFAPAWTAIEIALAHGEPASLHTGQASR
ncbi:MAG TPA: hypothetical protein VFP84_17880 [Kofleriaceae bacterium]|nr:hypothetical protein [Kofleriaceae bacterium]